MYLLIAPLSYFVTDGRFVNLIFVENVSPPPRTPTTIPLGVLGHIFRFDYSVKSCPNYHILLAKTGHPERVGWNRKDTKNITMSFYLFSVHT